MNPVDHHYRNNYEHHDIRDICRHYKMYHVIAHANDGSQFEGIIEDFDEDGVTMLVAEDIEEDDYRQFGYGRRRFRRFHRRRFPFHFFAFPFFRPYPFFFPFY